MFACLMHYIRYVDSVVHTIPESSPRVRWPNPVLLAHVFESNHDPRRPDDTSAQTQQYTCVIGATEYTIQAAEDKKILEQQATKKKGAPTNNTRKQGAPTNTANTIFARVKKNVNISTVEKCPLHPNAKHTKAECNAHKFLQESEYPQDATTWT